LPFELCTHEGCEASAILDQSALEKFLRGKMLTVRYASPGSATANIPIRLQGLADAMAQLSK
jgi:invasion protein IalB